MCLIQWPLPELKVTRSVESKIFWLHFLTHYSIDQDKILGSVVAIEVGYPDMSFERDLNVLREILLMCLIWWLCWLNPLSCGCCILGWQAQIFCRPPELGFEGSTNGSYLLPCLMAEWSGLQEMWTWWCLVRFSTGALSWGFFLCVFFQSFSECCSAAIAIVRQKVVVCLCYASWQWASWSWLYPLVLPWKFDFFLFRKRVLASL